MAIVKELTEYHTSQIEALTDIYYESFQSLNNFTKEDSRREIELCTQIPTLNLGVAYNDLDNICGFILHGEILPNYLALVSAGVRYNSSKFSQMDLVMALRYHKAYSQEESELNPTHLEDPTIIYKFKESPIDRVSSKDWFKYVTAVKKSEQGKNISSQLSEFAENKAKTEGAERIFTICNEKMSIKNQSLNYHPILQIAKYYKNGQIGWIMGKNLKKVF